MTRSIPAVRFYEQTVCLNPYASSNARNPPGSGGWMDAPSPHPAVGQQEGAGTREGAGAEPAASTVTAPGEPEESDAMCAAPDRPAAQPVDRKD